MPSIGPQWLYRSICIYRSAKPSINHFIGFSVFVFVSVSVFTLSLFLSLSLTIYVVPGARGGERRSISIFAPLSGQTAPQRPQPYHHCCHHRHRCHRRHHHCCHHHCYHHCQLLSCKQLHLLQLSRAQLLPTVEWWPSFEWQHSKVFKSHKILLLTTYCFFLQNLTHVPKSKVKYFINIFSRGKSLRLDGTLGGYPVKESQHHLSA